MISLREIEEIVRQYPPRFHPTRIEALGGAGGMSGAQFWRIDSGAGKLVLRRWPTEHPSPARLQFIHDVLFHAAAHGIGFLAIPIRTVGEKSFITTQGRLWELTRWLPGTADYFRSPSEAKLRAGMAALAQFHVAVQNFPPEPVPALTPPAVVARRLRRLHELWSQKYLELSRTIDLNHWPELKPLANCFLATLPSIVPRAISQLEPLSRVVLPRQPCIRDVWHDHILFSGESVTGLIDFGAIDIDTPATDLARLLGSLVGDNEAGWSAGIRAYAAVRPLSAVEIQVARALDYCSAILAGCNWLTWIGHEGRDFEDHARITNRFREIVARCKFRESTVPEHVSPDKH